MLPRIVPVALALLIGAGTLGGCGRSATHRSVRVEVSTRGLPAGIKPRIAVVERTFGGYAEGPSMPVFHLRDGTVSVPAGAVLDGGIQDGGQTGTEFVPASRFRPVPIHGGTVTFTYHEEYLVTVSHGAEGVPCSADGMGGGSTSIKNEWVRPGTQLTVRASADPGWRLAHWGIFSPSQTINETRASSVSNPLVLTVKAPVDINASFVPAC